MDSGSEGGGSQGLELLGPEGEGGWGPRLLGLEGGWSGGYKLLSPERGRGWGSHSRFLREEGLGP